MPKTGVITATFVHEINGYQPAPWGELVEQHRQRFGPPQFDALLGRIAGMGFTHVELWLVHTGHGLADPLWAHTTPADVQAMFAAHRLSLASYCVGGIGSTTDIAPLCDYAQALGAPMLTGWLGREPALWDKLAAYLERYDTRYGIEPHGPTYSLTTPDEMLAAMAVSPRIGACPDTGVWARHGLDPTDALAPLAERMIHMHLKGYHRAGDRNCAPGDDDIGLDRFVRAARDAGYDGVYSLEYEADHNSDAELTRARQWVIATLGR